MAVEDPHGINVRCQQSERRERASGGNELFGRTHRRGNVVANRAGNEHVGGIGGAFHPNRLAIHGAHLVLEAIKIRTASTRKLEIDAVTLVSPGR